ncbi:uncharacterized protein FA14DRAFT_157245 [Meira miltonrushii]|uniref:Uncharacterized protein n=1 Tax=Meira miltonrushii TaxID=1280837 RepID=A0A316VAJ2_9BASI|nr:uncharacterized protein FA14DRAFT_157245 [Meira miltonrushii]PWN32535.1 hypothetical protein FA14DRAFT_157245 [Meira miltonrushii]
MSEFLFQRYLCSSYHLYSHLLHSQKAFKARMIIGERGLMLINIRGCAGSPRKSRKKQLNNLDDVTQQQSNQIDGTPRFGTESEVTSLESLSLTFFSTFLSPLLTQLLSDPIMQASVKMHFAFLYIPLGLLLRRLVKDYLCFVVIMRMKLVVLIIVWSIFTPSINCATNVQTHEQEINQRVTKVATKIQTRADKNWKKADQWFKLRDRCFPPISTFCNHMANLRGKQAQKDTIRSLALQKGMNDRLKQAHPNSSHG